MFQNCPTCRSLGKLKRKICPVCCGERIINEENGLPPSKQGIPVSVPFYPYVPYFPLTPLYPTWEPSTITYCGSDGYKFTSITN